MTELIFLNRLRPEQMAITLAYNKIHWITQVLNGMPRRTPLKGLKLNPSTIVKSHPDLKGKPIGEIRKIGLERFEEHLKSMKTEKEAIDYISEELKMWGYDFKFIKKPGHRMKALR